MISPYGLKFIIPGIIVTAVVFLWAALTGTAVVFVFSAFFWIVILFLLFFYRNPYRNIPHDDSLVLSTADGKVLAVEDIEHDYIGGKGKKVSIFLSLLDVHINRIPAAGELDYIKYRPGKFHRAFDAAASESNECIEIGLKRRECKIIFRQIAGILARRIECTSRPHQKVHAGQVYGMIHFGSRAELFLPENVRVMVKKGDRVRAGETIVGRIGNKEVNQ
jgi:phosphatidylserine decarboxylase